MFSLIFPLVNFYKRKDESCGPKWCHAIPNGCPVEYCEPGLICTSKDTDTECGACVESNDFNYLMSLYCYFI